MVSRKNASNLLRLISLSDFLLQACLKDGHSDCVPTSPSPIYHLLLAHVFLLHCDIFENNALKCLLCLATNK